MAQVARTIVCKSRQSGTKGDARRLRASGWVPSVAYGPKSQPLNLAASSKEFVTTWMANGTSQLYDVKVESGESFKALIKDVQIDPIKRTPVHIDLFAVDMTKPLRVEVRLVLKGKAKGLIEGGLLSQLKRFLEISCLPDIIPEVLELDVTELGLGESAHLSDIKLPEGVKFTAHDDEAVAAVVAPEGADEAKDEGEEEEGAAEAAAAPAAEKKD